MSNAIRVVILASFVFASALAQFEEVGDIRGRRVVVVGEAGVEGGPAHTGDRLGRDEHGEPDIQLDRCPPLHHKPRQPGESARLQRIAATERSRQRQRPADV